MALQDILEQIKKETQDKLDALTKEHDAAVQKIDAEFEDLKKTTEENMEEKVTTNTKKIHNKMVTLARMEAKNKLLKSKREIMDIVFEEAIESLVSSSDYQKLLTDLLKHSSIDGDSVKVISAKGKEADTKAALSASGKSYQVSEESADIKGGFILKSDKIEIDNSFESILFKQLRDDLELEVAKNLFPA